MSLEQLKLENQFCFLVYRLEHNLMARYRPLLSPLGLTYPQYLVLLALWEFGNMGVAEVAEKLSLDTGTVSPLLKRMEAQGFLTRERSTLDERNVRVSLTKKGKLLEKKAADIPYQLLSCLGETVGDESGERRKIFESLKEVLDRMESNCV